MDKKFYKTINETLYHEQMDNGLNVYLLKKEGYEVVGLTMSLFKSNCISFEQVFFVL